jgi:hypothetical protein
MKCSVTVGIWNVTMGKSKQSTKKPGAVSKAFEMALTPGAHVKVRCSVAGFRFWHHGIISEVDDEAKGRQGIRVIHFAYAEGVTGGGNGAFRSIVETSLDWFLDGGADPCVEDYEPDFELTEVVKRARSLLGQRGYSLPVRNCEHFASWCRSRTPMSKQVDQVGSTALIAAAVFIAMGIALKLFANVPFA